MEALIEARQKVQETFEKKYFNLQSIEFILPLNAKKRVDFFNSLGSYNKY